MRVSVDKAGKEAAGNTDRARAGGRAESRQPPGATLPELAPPAELVAIQRKMQPPAELVAMQRKMQGANTTGDPIQRVITMKGGGESRRTSGDLLELTTEVQTSIQNNDLGEMKKDLLNLESSITNRHSLLTDYPYGDDPQSEYQRHLFRINEEKTLCGDLENAIALHPTTLKEEQDKLMREQKKEEKEEKKNKKKNQQNPKGGSLFSVLPDEE